MQEVQQLLATEFPKMRQVKTSSLHRGVSTAKHSFFQVPALENKLDHLAQVSIAISPTLLKSYLPGTEVEQSDHE
jgi:hypothetical protein